MKTKPTRTQPCVRAFVFCLVAVSEAAAKDATAFELAKEGNRYLGEQSKDKIVQIRSEKSIGGLTPDIWHIVYYDPDATLKAVKVKFGGGKKMAVSRPLRLLEPVMKGDEPLPKDKLKTDSDAALDIARKEPLLEKLTGPETPAAIREQAKVLMEKLRPTPAPANRDRWPFARRHASAAAAPRCRCWRSSPWKSRGSF